MSRKIAVLGGDGIGPEVTAEAVKVLRSTGAAFEFHAGDCSVEALSALPGEKTTGQRVRTDTTVEEKKSGSGKH